MTLTFKPGVHMTQDLGVRYISVKLFQNSFMHHEITTWTHLYKQLGRNFKYNLDSSQGATCCMDKIVLGYICVKLFQYPFINNNFMRQIPEQHCNLDLHGRKPGCAQNTWSSCGVHFCYIFLNPFIYQKGTPDTNYCHSFHKNLSRKSIRTTSVRWFLLGHKWDTMWKHNPSNINPQVNSDKPAHCSLIHLCQLIYDTQHMKWVLICGQHRPRSACA